MEKQKINRQILANKIIKYNEQIDIQGALKELSQSSSYILSNDEIHSVWHYISKSLDHTFSDDESHPLWLIEAELSRAYKRD